MAESTDKENRIYGQCLIHMHWHPYPNITVKIICDRNAIRDDQKLGSAEFILIDLDPQANVKLYLSNSITSRNIKK
ncbi:MAG: hypothetical protein WBA13_10825 [Microcoleaceae cyanobacterium]